MQSNGVGQADGSLLLAYPAGTAMTGSSRIETRFLQATIRRVQIHDLTGSGMQKSKSESADCWKLSA